MTDHKYLVHHENSEIQLRAQDSVALGFCRIIESIPVDDMPNSTTHRDEWLAWHDKWTQYFIKKYNLNPDNVQ